MAKAAAQAPLRFVVPVADKVKRCTTTARCARSVADRADLQRGCIFGTAMDQRQSLYGARVARRCGATVSVANPWPNEQ